MSVIGPLPLNKGWMADSDIWNCPPGGALTFTSFMPWANGSIKTIDGYNAFSNAQLASKTSILGMTSWQDPAQIGTNGPVVVLASNSKIYTGPISTLTFTDRTGATTPATSGVYTFDSLNGKLLLFNSGSTFTSVPLVLTTYNGNVSNLGGTPPIGNAVKVVNNFAFVTQVLASSSTASSVYWCAVGDPTTWPAASFLQFRNNDGDFTTALSSLGTNLVIFKRFSMGLLNTTTTTISGAVTLGPLTTVSDKIGCVGPNAVDAMIDGSIVFLAMDRKLYRSDGTILSELSSLPSPNSNYNLAVNFPIGSTPPDLGSGTSVRVDPLFNRIWVKLDAHSGTVNPVYVYDYHYRAWMDWTELSNDLSTGTGSGGVNCLALMPNEQANNYSQANSVWTGTTTGFLQTYAPYTAFQHDSASQTWPCVFETSIQLGGSNPPDFIPRAIIIPYTQPNGTGVSASISIGWDGTYQTTPIYTTALNAASGRIIIRIAEYLNTTYIHPITLQLKITLTGNVTGKQTVIEPIYLSDEVLG